jgi:hypothetical protein
MDTPRADYDLVPGNRYNFHTSDGTVYVGAEFVSGHPEIGIMIAYGVATVYIAPHEYDFADDWDESQDWTDHFK